MSSTKIPPKIQNILWAISAGRCQFKGCHKCLFEELKTKKRTNLSNIAHIIADSPDGPRGDANLSNALKNNLDNLMLLCRDHHKLIDDNDHWEDYPVRLLQTWKKEHENWIANVLQLKPEHNTLVLGMFSNIGFDAKPLFHKDNLHKAIESNGNYPRTSEPIIVDYTYLHLNDKSSNYWTLLENELKHELTLQLRGKASLNSAESLSIFALAPMPLLMLLGKLIGDTNRVNIFQYHRKEQSWVWPIETISPLNIKAHWPTNTPKHISEIGLALMISDNGDIELMQSTIGTEIPFIIVECENANQNIIRSSSNLIEFKITLRNLLNQISTRFPKASIHCFPVMPVSAAIEFGRLLLPKSDPTIWIYDRNKPDGYKKTIKL